MQSNGASAVAGAAGITSPVWLSFLDPFYQVIVAGLGFILLLLTIRNKWLDLKIKAATLNEIKAGVEHIAEAVDAAPNAEIKAELDEIKEAVLKNDQS
ncbi:hypothetical protein [Roseobacter litoralis]|uniref:hypothetical protein n=1 Tax=Roseobacter litoralis TaxID=42443 RepID=UPI002494EFB0|nr:hypothetical protein [Roseobacter litoralis]